MVKTLYNLSQLRDAKFGQPDPRHGLKLLWWFAHDYVDIDSNGLYTRHDPANGRFGFHRFNNTERILPLNHQYYKTGNLTHPDLLPDYVTEYYTGYSDASNTDRLIVSVCSRNNGKVWLNDVYVTQHLGQVQFDRNRTYRISLDLIKDIKNLNRAEFLKQMNNEQNSLSIEIELPEDSTQEQQRSYNSTEKDCERCSMLLYILLLFVLLYVYLHKF